MEGVAVDLAVETLKFVVGSFVNQLREQKLLISKVQKEADQLSDDIVFLQDYQKKFSTKSNSHNIITRDLLGKVRDSIYVAEDAIDSYVIESARTGYKNLLLPGNSKLADVAQLVQSVCANVKAIRADVERHIEKTTDKSQNGDLKKDEEPPRKRKYGPIFKEQEKTLRSRIGQVGEQLEVIVISGMPGIGKTTLAAKMFNDEKIQMNFKKSIWVTVSQTSPENIFHSIMSQRFPGNHDLPLPQPQQQLVADCLQQDPLFIVMDDVQETQAWEGLRAVFENCNKKSKVLVTTYNDEVARYIGEYFPIELKQLNSDDSWSLLQWRVSMDHGCPKELEITGKSIADQCEGLPLVIDQFVGKVFARMDSRSFDITERQKIWRDVSIDVRTYFTTDYKTNILSIYNNLPYERRACFLYLGIFPRRSVFSVSKLIRMWIAEGFIQPSDKHSLEEMAATHLKYLTDRNLVIIEDRMPDGSLKTCRMNYLFHDFCKTEAGHERENFLQEFIKSDSDGSFNPQINKVNKTRRYCIHGHISTFIPAFISSRPNGNGLRVWLHSFVSHSDKEVFTLRGKNKSIIRAAFKLLRVLDAKPIAFNKIPNDLYELIHLRFVTISLNRDVLPESISKLRNVQTLIVHTPSRTLTIKADILKMAELRHLKTNASATLPKTSGASQNGERLQTLCGVSPKSCTDKFFSKTPNLKKLGIRGQLALLLDGNNDQLLVKLDKLEKLKLLNDATSSVPQGNNLLQPTRFPLTLKSLTLSATSLDWGYISLLGSLEKLEELKLKDNAFIGEKWEVNGESFPSLQTLHIQGLDFVHWGSSRDHLPKLRRLELFECKKLRNVPVGLADISTFQLLDLRNGIASAAASARSIAEVKKKMNQTDNKVIFKLSILPEDL